MINKSIGLVCLKNNFQQITNVYRLLGIGYTVVV